MRPESIRRLALADVKGDRLRALIEHGEDLLVERKREPPEGSKFGAEVSSLARDALRIAGAAMWQRSGTSPTKRSAAGSS